MAVSAPVVVASIVSRAHGLAYLIEGSALEAFRSRRRRPPNNAE